MSTKTPDGVLSASWMSEDPVVSVLTALGAPHVDVRFVGGCVRDTVLGRSVSDIDLATPDVPDVVIEKLEAAGLKAIPTGLSHGTVTAVADGRGFEVTTLRRDTATDGRHAEVEFTTDWSEDAARRDFTFNALSARPDGSLYDPFGGADDAKAGRVTFIGDPSDRIKEDYLRILRFFRFVAHYGREDPPDTVLQSCRDHAAGLANLSVERIREEIVKLLGAPDPVPAVSAMVRSGVLQAVLPEANGKDALADLVRTERIAGEEPAGDVWQRRFAVLFDQSRPAQVAARLRCSNKQQDRLAALESAADEAGAALRQPQRNRFLHFTHSDVTCDAVLIAWSRNRGGDDAQWQALLDAARTWQPKVFPISGKDAKAAGLTQGPVIGNSLQALELEWVDGGFAASEDDLRARLRKMPIQKDVAPPKGAGPKTEQ